MSRISSPIVMTRDAGMRDRFKNGLQFRGLAQEARAARIVIDQRRCPRTQDSLDIRPRVRACDRQAEARAAAPGKSLMRATHETAHVPGDERQLPGCHAKSPERFARSADPGQPRYSPARSSLRSPGGRRPCEIAIHQQAGLPLTSRTQWFVLHAPMSPDLMRAMSRAMRPRMCRAMNGSFQDATPNRLARALRADLPRGAV